jgi:hypothetical protein
MDDEWSILFYVNEQGDAPVLAFLTSLDHKRVFNEWLGW